VRSHSSAALHAVTVAAVLLAMPVGASPVPQQPVRVNAERPGRQEIARAIDTVKADPNLTSERTIRILRWKDSSAPAPSGIPAWLTWIAGLFRWLDQSARLLVWCAAVLLAGLLVVFIVRLRRTYGMPRGKEPFVAPTHVRDLDIRPESLPDDIGMAARALWDCGEQRAALALLYRGLLSRLVHIHRVPVHDSSTEGDCLTLAAAHLIRERSEYASQLIHVWQRCVYGHEDLPAATVHRLCDDFASALGSVSPWESVAPGSAA
jgi:Domain of unknown function (DUF4129)